MISRTTPTLFMLTVLFSISTTTTAEQKTYTVGIVPQFEAKKLRRIWKPILKQLEQKTGLNFKLRGAPTIPAFEKEFLVGKFDFSYMNPFHLLIANETQGYIPLVRDHSKKLQGVLVVRKDSEIKSIKDLNNKKIAFPSPNALGASLQMRAELHDKFKINITPVYVKTHDSVYLNVYLKQVSAGGGVGKTFHKQAERLRDSLKIIHRTTPVAPHPIAVHPRVPKTDRDKVAAALFEIANSEEGKKLLAQIPIKKLGKASMQDYKPLDKMNLKRFFVSQ
jgi:phosphate/phosphite/phosphonate ABC transporter binding protein